MSELIAKEQLEAILKDAYPDEMKLFDEYVMQNPVLTTEQKFTIIFKLFASKLESACKESNQSPQVFPRQDGKWVLLQDEMREQEMIKRLSKPTVLWKDMTEEEKKVITKVLNEWERPVLYKGRSASKDTMSSEVAYDGSRPWGSSSWCGLNYYWIGE